MRADNFRQLVGMMVQNSDDYAAFGQAFSADQEAVTDSTQRLRSQAYVAGGCAAIQNK